jgi:hypothetical protein
MTDISEAHRATLITQAEVNLVLEEAEIVEDEVRAFSQDRARQRRPYRPHSPQIIPFPKKSP